MTTPIDTMKTLQAAAKATEALRETEATLRARHTKAVRDRRATWAALASRDAVRTHAADLVEKAATAWRAQHGAMWTRALSGYQDIRGVDTEREVRVRPQLPDLMPTDLSLPALCGLCPDAVLASMIAMIDAQPDTVFGLAEADRTACLAQLDAQIADLEQQHTALVDAAGDAGLTLPLLADVRDRRAAAQADTERAHALAAERARRATVGAATAGTYGG